MEIEDDLFFAELSEQIALLIMDEEEEFPLQCQPLPLQGFNHVPQAMVPPLYTYYDVAYTGESKGTGVFIPRFTAPKRKHRAGRSGSNNASAHKNNANSQKRHQEKKRVAVSNNTSIAGKKEKTRPLSSQSH
ncbi:S100P-binding protein [Rhynchospora pubera]|uniref:S100P-binding protein n=1 Tax=Rhynchospora pubera TaxID=906938 RepID=A0AAV8EFC5_9POAL|nr:S100P-binding protein [Rhynchospora pubera]